MSIDYGGGLVNIDHATGIRYGVISQHSLGSGFFDNFEPDYGSPQCPRCGHEADTPDTFGESFVDGRPDDYTNERFESDEFVCVGCKHFFGSESAFGDDPVAHYLDVDGIHAESCLDSDVMVTKSPYYTLAPFCSPCVPGAGNLDDAKDGRGVKTYCFDHSWFEDGKAPYRVFRVEGDEEVLP